MVVKLGIIGYKNHAERLLNILDKKRDCCLKFIYHPTKKIKDVRGTNKISDLLSCDGILIASPNNTHFSYLKKLEKFLLRTPIVLWAFWASNLYHNQYWLRFIGSKRVKAAMKTQWGKLFDKY